MYPICITNVQSQISVLFNLQPTVFEIQPFGKKCTEWPQNDFGHYKVIGTPCATSVPVSQISLHVALRPVVVESQDILRQVRAPNDPKMTLIAIRSSVPHICVTSVPDFCPFRSTTRCFQVTGHFKTSVEENDVFTPSVSDVYFQRRWRLKFYSHMVLCERKRKT